MRTSTANADVNGIRASLQALIAFLSSVATIRAFVSARCVAHLG
jgi:hypothetical protein